MRVTPSPPLCTAYRPILALRIVYRHFFDPRTAYHLHVTTKTTIFGVSIYIKKIKGQLLSFSAFINVNFLTLILGGRKLGNITSKHIKANICKNYCTCAFNILSVC